MKNQLPALILSSLFLVTAIQPATAQTTGAPAAIYMSGAAVEAELQRVAAASASAAGWAVRVSPGITVRRRSSDVLQYAVMHPFSVEIYHIMAGSGTLVTGGTLTLPLASSTGPNIIRTENGISGGLARQVKPGDILVLQPGTPHWFSHIDGDSITYMESRVQISSQPIQFQ
jgi:mannose-6-phosphate isomerase-like protein (cupin superfamily)